MTLDDAPKVCRRTNSEALCLRSTSFPIELQVFPLKEFPDSTCNRCAEGWKLTELHDLGAPHHAITRLVGHKLSHYRIGLSGFSAVPAAVFHEPKPKVKRKARRLSKGKPPNAIIGLAMKVDELRRRIHCPMDNTTSRAVLEATFLRKLWNDHRAIRRSLLEELP